MTTLIAQNFGNATDTVPYSDLLEGTERAGARYSFTTGLIGYTRNVSSITDNASGDFSVYFLNAFLNRFHCSIPCAMYATQRSSHFSMHYQFPQTSLYWRGRNGVFFLFGPGPDTDETSLKTTGDLA